MVQKNIPIHEKYMRRCFELAKHGNSFVAPNPMVGAVLVYNDRIIGEGFHAQFGAAHAEVNCLNSVVPEQQHLIAHSTLYVSLEPCSHFGKTPPCVDLIIQHKIPKVVIAVLDKFDLVNGKGIEKLIENNIEVITGILEIEGEELLKHFLSFQHKKRPYITLKFAQTKDGFIGIKKEELKISNSLSQHYTHQLRAEHQAILVGKTTVLTDNPKLNVRLVNGKNPVRLVIGTKQHIPITHHIFNQEAETFFIHHPTEKISIPTIIEMLKNRNIISVLIEGGANVLQQFIDAGIWEEAHIITHQQNLNEITEEKNELKYIQSPIITGNLVRSFSLQDDIIHVLKNSNDLSYT
jgi:diaminohydroxyphosphoribosylaminopyrimidine deaminase/5-amino-6-(5-phosphoribosylamino)uracil reductase